MLTQQQPDINFENARRTHHEYYAPALVNAWWLRLFCAGLVVALIVLGLGSLRLAKQLKREKILVVASAHDGSFDRVEYVNMADYQPTDRVVEHFAYVWAVKYYSRNRATIAEDYPESLKFFSSDLVALLKAQAEQSQWLVNFQSAADPEIRIQVKKVRLEKGAITIDFEKHFSLAGREVSGQTENWTTQVSYTLTPIDQITTGMIPSNPIGLKITALPLETKGF
jgi:type IV secretory pathway component VirB8